MGKLTKFSSGAVILKKPLPKPEAFNVGEFAKAIAADAGAMVKVTPLNTFAKLIKSEKWEKPVVHLGVAGGDLIITGQSANGKQDSVVVMKGYEKMKKNREKVAVINADKGDKTIDSSSARMAKAKGVDVQNAKDAKISDVKGDIIILAHGGSKGSSPGKVYANRFANKKAADIVKYLAKDKKLPVTYNGTVYLDGCFTAAGASKGTLQKDLNNFAGSVYAGLKKLGYAKLQVKGNLGTAVTLDDGKEGIVDAQMEVAFKKAMKPYISKRDKARKVLDKANKPFKAAAIERVKLQKAKKELERSDNPKKEALLKKVDAKLDKAEKTFQKAKLLSEKADNALDKAQKEYLAARDKLAKDKGIKRDAIDDLVGTFGPETI